MSLLRDHPTPTPQPLDPLLLLLARRIACLLVAGRYGSAAAATGAGARGGGRAGWEDDGLEAPEAGDAVGLGEFVAKEIESSRSSC